MNTSPKKVIGIMLACIVVVTALSALFQWCRGRNVQREFADTRRALREQGFKTNLADFNVITDPATRARATALTVFNEPLGLDSNGDQLDLLPRVSDDAAAVIWKQDSLTVGHGILQWSDLHAVLDANNEALDAACDAALSGPILFDADLSNPGSKWEIHAVALRNLSWMLTDRAMLDLHEAHLDPAWTNLLGVTRLATAWEPESIGICHLFDPALADVAFDDNWQALQNGHWPDARLAVLQREWESVNFFTHLPERTALERAEVVNYCRQLSKRSPFAFISPSELAKEIIQEPSEGFSDLKRIIQIMRYGDKESLSDEKKLLLFFGTANSKTAMPSSRQPGQRCKRSPA